MFLMNVDAGLTILRNVDTNKIFQMDVDIEKTLKMSKLKMKRILLMKKLKEEKGQRKRKKHVNNPQNLHHPLQRKKKPPVKKLILKKKKMLHQVKRRATVNLIPKMECRRKLMLLKRLKKCYSTSLNHGESVKRHLDRNPATPAVMRNRARRLVKLQHRKRLRKRKNPLRRVVALLQRRRTPLQIPVMRNRARRL